MDNNNSSNNNRHRNNNNGSSNNNRPRRIITRPNYPKFVYPENFLESIQFGDVDAVLAYIKHMREENQDAVNIPILVYASEPFFHRTTMTPLQIALKSNILSDAELIADGLNPLFYTKHLYSHEIHSKHLPLARSVLSTVISEEILKSATDDDLIHSFMVKLLIDYGANINAHVNGNTVDNNYDPSEEEYGARLLATAVNSENPMDVSLLLDAGASSNTHVMELGDTPLSLAIRRAHLVDSERAFQVIEVLMDHNVNTNEIYEHELEPEFTKKLIEHGVPPKKLLHKYFKEPDTLTQEGLLHLTNKKARLGPMTSKALSTIFGRSWKQRRHLMLNAPRNWAAMYFVNKAGIYREKTAKNRNNTGNGSNNSNNSNNNKTNKKNNSNNNKTNKKNNSNNNKNNKRSNKTKKSKRKSN
jgi:hypothetical protein